MEQRVLGRTGRPVSVIGLGTWQLGADWGNVSERDALAILEAATESGVTFFEDFGHTDITPVLPSGPTTHVR
jgi:aryl-alcohol dehydrogenase-like predicted oxidoreductase